VIESRVARLDVSASADERIADAVRGQAPSFARRVLSRCADLLEERVPGRCIFMRRLDTSWRLFADLLDDDREVAAVAVALADGVERELKNAREPSGDVASFASEIEYRAEYLLAAAEGRAGAWYFRLLIDEGGPAGIPGSSTSATVVQAVLEHLAATARLGPALAKLPPDAVAYLTRVLDAGNLSSDQEANDVTAEEAAALDELPVSASMNASRVFCATSARRILGPSASDCRLRAAAQRLFAHALARRSKGIEDRSTPVDRLASAREVTTDLASAVDAAGVTARGGLFYLLILALELSLGEALWKACLREDVFFAKVARMLAGADAANDPAPELFGGASPSLPLTPIDPEQFHELAIGLLAESAAALPRRELATRPTIEWRIGHARVGRLLLAVPTRTDLPVFAWPAPTGSALAEGLRRFSEVWPTGLVVAHPALADADPAHRVRSDVRIPLSGPVLIADADDLAHAAALTQAAGSLAYLFGARVAPPEPPTAASLAERYFTVPARITRDRDTMIVRMPSDRIDTSIRRAGLDHDPGWIPWLRAQVRIEYDGLANGYSD
jgi:hypothetical protein